MATNSSNQLTVQITDELRNKSLEHLTNLKTYSNLGIALTEDERKSLKKVAGRSREMLRDLYTAILDFPAIQPGSEEMPMLDLEIATYDLTDDMETKLLERLQELRDAKYFAGDMAYRRCSTAYGILKVLAGKKGGIYKIRFDDLQKKHFSKTPKNGGDNGKNTLPKPG